MNNSVLYVGLSAIRDNARAILRSLPVGCGLIPVLKDDAYGLGLVPVAKALCALPDVACIAVSHVSEGLALRDAGISCEVLVMSSPLPFQLAAAAAADLTLTVARTGLIPTLPAGMRLQIKLETGLGRIGVAPGEELEAVIRELAEAGSHTVTGVFSHFADPEDAARSARQMQIYLSGIRQLNRAGIAVPVRHISCSAASELLPQYAMDAVRVGRRLYLDHPTAPTGKIREAFSWRTYITAVYERRQGERIGYGEGVLLERDTRTAVLGVGYGDGLPPAFAEKRMPVLIRGRRCPLLVCCMDQAVADVTGLDCEVGDEVTILGSDGYGGFLSAQEAANEIGAAEGCAITSGLSARVARVYR